MARVVEVTLTDRPDLTTDGAAGADISIRSDLVGEWRGSTRIPVLGYSDLDLLENWVSESPVTAGPDFLSHRQQMATLGSALFEATLGAWGQWPNAVDAARRERSTLRVEIQTASDLLAAQPWELLRDPETGADLAIEPQVSIVRNPQRRGPVSTIASGHPLRVLLVGAQPSDAGQIAIEQELQVLASILGGFGGAIEVHRLTADSRVATLDGLAAALAAGPWHIVHFAGHGGFDPVLGEGMLLFTRPDGSTDATTASRFGGLVASAGTVRLVTLNACRGAMGAGRQVVRSVAGAIMQRGIPACVSMQFEVTDGAAIPFARAFYSGIVSHGDVERAVMEGRRAVADVQIMPGGGIATAVRSFEWITPVLHLDSPDTAIFATGGTGAGVAGAPSTPVAATVPATTRASLTQVERLHWRLEYAEALGTARALERAEGALRASVPVRSFEKSGDTFSAQVGGLIAWLPSQTVTAQGTAIGGGTQVTMDSRQSNGTLFDQGENEANLRRVAAYLGLEV